MKTTRWHSCNVLRVGADARQLWQFATGNSQVSLNAEQRLVSPAPLPLRLITKDWRTLWRRKLNIAWLPTEQVFLRVVHLPKCEPDELRSMVELQLEKLSPFPANQIVWSLEIVPGSSGELQTVIVIVAERSLVEDFLGKLESAGYLADRLELPFLHQLLTTPIDGDGVWIYLQPAEARTLCLSAWWCGGVLQRVNLLNLPAGEAGASVFGARLNQIAWAGEIEGWLAAPPRWRLVAEQAVASVWESALRQWANEPIELVPPLTVPALAALTAQRAARSESKANLLPAEFSTRYQQQFIDRLWMRGLAGLAVVYVFGVLIYLGALHVFKYQAGKVQNQVAALSGAYTNALQLKERVRILQEQVNLKFAALDCWKVASELLPPELTLTSFNFSKGDRILLRGNAHDEDEPKITEYNEAMSKA
ncbi:MAG: hypothetical protein DME19_05180, partial [Verrucomicrobia bacterium]